MIEHFSGKTFTDSAERAITLAQEEARNLGHCFAGTEQLLLGLIAEDTGIAANTLKSMGINLKDARAEVKEIIGDGQLVPPEIQLTPRAKKALELAGNAAGQLRNKYIDTEHILLGVINEGEGVAARVLENLGVNPEALKAALLAATTGYVGNNSEQNPAAENSAQSVQFEEPTNENSVEIIKEVKTKYEEQYRLKISDDAIAAAVNLSGRLLNGTPLPQKAINVIIEACSLKYSKMYPEKAALEKQLKELIKEKENAIRSYEFDTAARLREEEDVLKNKINAQTVKNTNEEPIVTAENIVEVIALMASGDFEG